MTEKQQQFLNLAIIDQKGYDEIVNELNIDRKTLTKWWDELKEEREILSKLRIVWKNKFDSVITPFEKFQKWYSNSIKECFYCSITQEQLNELYKKDKLHTKRNRGRKLEIERKIPDKPYDDLGNLVFSCYWCNNAKTDTFTAEEFKKVGEEIGKIWQKRLNDDN